MPAYPTEESAVTGSACSLESSQARVSFQKAESAECSDLTFSEHNSPLWAEAPINTEVETETNTFGGGRGGRKEEG